MLKNSVALWTTYPDRPLRLTVSCNEPYLRRAFIAPQPHIALLPEGAKSGHLHLTSLHRLRRHTSQSAAKINFVVEHLHQVAVNGDDLIVPVTTNDSTDDERGKTTTAATVIGNDLRAFLHELTLDTDDRCSRKT